MEVLLVCFVPIGIFFAGFVAGVVVSKYEIRPRQQYEQAEPGRAAAIGGKQQWQP
jgi:hypothetical protein